MEDNSYMMGQLIGYALSNEDMYNKLQEKAKSKGTTIEKMIIKKFEHGRKKPSGILGGKEFQDNMEFRPEGPSDKMNVKPTGILPGRNKERSKI